MAARKLAETKKYDAIICLDVCCAEIRRTRCDRERSDAGDWAVGAGRREFSCFRVLLGENLEQAD